MNRDLLPPTSLGPRWRRRIACGSLTCAIACLAFFPRDAFARAGGGGGFGGGGGGGGGGGFGGGGSGSGGDLRGFLVMMAILAVVTVIRMIVEAHQRRVSRMIRDAHERQSQALREQALSKITSADPAFTLDAFLTRAESAFLQIQEAWTQQDMRPVRAFISDGILERFSMQLAMQQAEGIRNVMQDVRVKDVQLAAAIATDQFDTLHLRILAAAVDYQIDVKSGREVAGTRRDEQFVEFWSFHRRHGATTQTRGGSIEGRCPQCGSPLTIVDKAQCATCSAWVNSAEHDWVLAEITQQSEWNLPGDAATTPGVATLRASDPGFSIQHVEDRVSVMFWRLRAAEFYADVAHASPVLGETAAGLRGAVELTLRQRRFFHEPAVGLVDLIDVLPARDGRRSGEATSGSDVARVKIRWSGTEHFGDSRGRSQMMHRKAIYTEVYLLERRAGVQSGIDRTFASASCPGCGASLGVNRDAACRFCGTSLTDGSHDWVLVDVRPFTAEINRYSESLQSRFELMDPVCALAAPGHTPHADRGLDLAIIARVLTMDGELKKREVAAFRKLADRQGLAKAEADLMLTNADYLDVPLPVPLSTQEARRQLEQVAYATLIDGRLSNGEKKLLSRYANRFELVAADVKMIVRQARAQLYREARDSRNGRHRRTEA